MAYDVFISYASEDKIVADAVCATLESHAVRCWIAPRDVLPGMAYGEAIIEAIRGCRIMVLVFSSKSNSSPHIPKEIERAVSAGVAVIPFRIEDVRPGKSLDYFIGSVHWLDALTQPLEQHLQRLVQNVQTLLTRDVVVIDPKKSSAVTAPAPAVASMPAPVAPGPARPPWLYAALAIMAVLLIVFAVLLFARKPSRTAQTPPPATSAPTAAAPAAPPPATSAPAGSAPPAAAAPPSEISNAASDAAVASKPGISSAAPPSPESKADVHGTTSAPGKPKTPEASASAEDLFDQGSASYKGRQFPQAAKLFQRACDGGERKACNSLGLMYYKGEGVPKDVKRGQLLYKRACDAGGPGGCLNLGLLYFRGEDVPKDLNRAAALFKRSCDDGGAPGCNNLGLMYHNGDGMPKDLKRSADLYKRACDHGGPAGCTNLGSMYWRGEEVPKDLSQAADLFKRGCDADSPAGCNYLGLLYERGQGVPQDSSRAADLFKKACDAGNEPGCGNLSRAKQ
jgi:TPR repeat protein